MKREDVWEFDRLTSLSTFGSDEDVEEVQKKPLLRARLALEIALSKFGDHEGPGQDIVKISSRVSLSYVHMELGNYDSALKLAKDVLASIPDYESDPTSDAARTTLLKRLEGTARMYAAEATAKNGDAVGSIKFIAGEFEETMIEKLATDLAGVTLRAASSDPQAKTRLAKAQTMVQCSASAASACLDNPPISKQLALSAQAYENSYSVSREDSYAGKALLYNMLRDENHGAALSFLRSSR